MGCGKQLYRATETRIRQNLIDNLVLWGFQKNTRTVTPFSSVVFRVEATVFLKFLENLPSLAVGHEPGEYLAQHGFFCGRFEREEDQLLKLHPTMNGF